MNRSLKAEVDLVADMNEALFMLQIFESSIVGGYEPQPDYFYWKGRVDELAQQMNQCAPMPSFNNGFVKNEDNDHV